MIQSPSVQYMPQVQPAINAQPQNYLVGPATPQYSNPGVIYNYPTTSSYMPKAACGLDKSQFNGVNIEILNPQGVGGVPQNAVQMPAQYYPVQNQVFVPPFQLPPAQPAAQTPVAQTTPTEIVTDNTTQVPAPQIQPAAPTANPAAAPVVDTTVAPTQAPDSSITPESFAGKLRTDDLDAQKLAIEEIAETVKNDATSGPILLDTQVFDALVEVINKDTTQLEGPAPEVIELRNKPQDQLTEEEKVKATTPTPLEKAEINKQYALYTISYMQERLNNELETRNGAALELKDLPCIETVIDAAKANPNPMVRIGALASLSHIARPEYANDLKTIFELAEADEDAGVKETATTAKQALPAAKEAVAQSTTA